MKILFIRPIGHFNIVEEKCQDNSQAKENIYFILSFYNLFPTYYRANIPPKNTLSNPLELGIAKCGQPADNLQLPAMRQKAKPNPLAAASSGIFRPPLLASQSLHFSSPSPTFKMRFFIRFFCFYFTFRQFSFGFINFHCHRLNGWLI